MANFKISEIVAATGGAVARGGGGTARGVTIDSRRVPRGSVFFAVKGERHDGHAFVGAAIKAGARAAVVSDPSCAADAGRGAAVIVVKDTVAALQALAAYHRRRFPKLKLVAVTGSNGKTTVKEMIAAGMARAWPTLKTEGNLNNHVGAPLTLLRLTARHKAAVIEMGMNHPGEIAALARMARPTVGVITNIGPAHLEGLGSLAAVRRAKGELLDEMPRGGVAVLNADDPPSRPLIARWKGNALTFGQSGRASVRLVEARLSRRGGYDAVVARGAKRWGLHVPLAGRHNALNAVAALAACMAAGAPPEKAARGIARVAAADMRLNVMKLPNGARLINDAYNANPASTRAALMASAELAGGGRLYFAFGDMLELGKESGALHRAVAHDAARAGVARIVAFGKRAALTAQEARAMGIPGDTRATRRAVAAWLAKRLRPGDVALVKGSRGMAMEKAVEELVSMMRG